ncbi:MAG: hypothetical protein ACOC4M_08250 [Promethearchaeia archaeon]
MSKQKNIKNLESDIKELIEEQLNRTPALIGINIGTLTGTPVTSMFKKKDEFLNEVEIASATSSLIFLASKMLKGTLNQEISYNLVTGKKYILITILTENITMIAYLDRELADLEGLNEVIKSLRELALHISAIIETSGLAKEELFVAIKRSIPNALLIAIITKEGLPIKIQATMPEPTISAMISAVFDLSDVLIKDFEYSVIAGEMGSIIIHELDNNRILCVAVPEADESKLGSYIVKIKSIIKS